MSNIKKVFRNTFAGILNSIFLLGLNLLSRNLFLQYIGIDYLSVAQVIANFLILFSFTDLGLSAAVLYLLYEPVATDNEEKIKKILWLYRRFNQYVGVAVLGIGIVFIPLLMLFIKVDIPNSIVYLIYGLNLITVVSTYFFSYRIVLLSAYQKDYIISFSQTIISFFRIIIQCLLIYLTHNYLLYLVVGLVAIIGQNGIAYHWTGRLYPYIKNIYYDGIELSLKSLRKELFSKISSMAVVRFAGLVIDNTDLILVSWLNTIMVGLCSNYMMISTQLKTLISIFHASLLHSLGVTIIDKTAEEKYSLFRQVLLINNFVTVLTTVCLGVLWNDFILLWLSDKYIVSSSIFYSMLLNYEYVMILAPIWIFRDSAGLFVYVKRILLINAILNLILSIIMGKLMGVAGVYFATILAGLVTNFWFDSNLVYEELFNKRNAVSYWINVSENFFISILLIGTFNYLTSSWQITLWMWLVKAIFIIFIYICVFVLRNFYTVPFRKTVQQCEVWINRRRLAR